MKRYNSVLDPRISHRRKQKKVTQKLIYRICDTLRCANDPKDINDLCHECEECGLIFDRNRVTEPNYLYNIAKAALNN